RLGLPKIDAWLDYTEYLHHAVPPVRDQLRIRTKGTRRRRHVNIVLVRILWDRGQNADHRVNAVVHGEGAIHHGGIAAKTSKPIFITQQQDGGRSGLLIIRTEVPSQQRLHAEHVEKVPGHYAGHNSLRFLAPKQDKSHIVVFDDSTQRMI